MGLHHFPFFYFVLHFCSIPKVVLNLFLHQFFFPNILSNEFEKTERINITLMAGSLLPTNLARLAARNRSTRTMSSAAVRTSRVGKHSMARTMACDIKVAASSIRACCHKLLPKIKAVRNTFFKVLHFDNNCFGLKDAPPFLICRSGMSFIDFNGCLVAVNIDLEGNSTLLYCLLICTVGNTKRVVIVSKVCIGIVLEKNKKKNGQKKKKKTKKNKKK